MAIETQEKFNIKEVRELINSEMKCFSSKYEGYFILRVGVEILTMNFQKYALRNVYKGLFEKLSYLFMKSKKCIEKNLRILIEHAEGKYKGMTIKEVMLEMSLSILDEMEARKKNE